MISRLGTQLAKHHCNVRAVCPAAGAHLAVKKSVAGLSSKALLPVTTELRSVAGGLGSTLKTIQVRCMRADAAAVPSCVHVGMCVCVCVWARRT